MKVKWIESILRPWLSWVFKYSVWIVLFFGLLSAASLTYTVKNLGVNTDLSDMISEDLEFHKRWIEYKESFPRLNETILLVFEGEQSRLEAARVLRELESADEFENVVWLTDPRFFESKGLLYAGYEQIQEFNDNLNPMRRLIQSYGAQPNVSRFFQVNSRVLRSDDTAEWRREVSGSVEASLTGRNQALDYGSVVFGESPQDKHFIEIKPKMDYELLLPAEASIEKVSELRESLGASFKITGVAALGYEELQSVSSGAGFAGLLSLLLVAGILFFGFRSGRLIFVSLSTLIVGLVLTGGFAALAIGHLNLISVAFAVLFIGLGIDYSIHLSLRFRELVSEGREQHEALFQGMREIGSSLVLCTLTTASGFYAFVPTAYAGVSELGLISGTGMFINLLVHLVFFPALLNILTKKKLHWKTLGASLGGALSHLAFRRARFFRVGTFIMALACLPFALQVEFDSNPLNLQDDSTEAYQSYRELLKDKELSPWTIKALYSDKDQMLEDKRKLEELESVSSVISVFDLIPKDQDRKLELISELSFPEAVSAEPEDSVQEIQGSAKQMIRSLPDENEDSGLEESLTELIDVLDEAPEPDLVIESLRSNLILPSNDFLNRLSSYSDLESLGVEDLPLGLRQRYLNSGGLYRLEVFPSEDLMDVHAMRDFSEEVLSVVPHATDDPVTLPYSGDAVVDAFLKASLIAFSLIFVLLFLITRSFRDSLIVLCPLFVAGLVLKALMSLFGLPFNFANIIVLPLLLGIGVDSGVHLLHRLRMDSSAQGIVGSTSRSVFFSALTTICSFGTLSLSTHRGTASMGILLTLGTLVVMLSTLVVVPAIVGAKKGQTTDG